MIFLSCVTMDNFASLKFLDALNWEKNQSAPFLTFLGGLKCLVLAYLCVLSGDLQQES